MHSNALENEVLKRTLNLCIVLQTLVWTHSGGESGASPVSTSAAWSELFRGVSVQHPGLEARRRQDACQARGWRWHRTVLQTTGSQGVLFLVQVSKKLSYCHCVGLSLSLKEEFLVNRITQGIIRSLKVKKHCGSIDHMKKQSSNVCTYSHPPGKITWQGIQCRSYCLYRSETFLKTLNLGWSAWVNFVLLKVQPRNLCALH